MRGVQQSLGRNAAPVKTNPAQARIALDEDHFFAQVRRIKSRGIPSRAAANDNDFGFDWIHKISS
jgi:hypothetical protein